MNHNANIFGDRSLPKGYSPTGWERLCHRGKCILLFPLPNIFLSNKIWRKFSGPKNVLEFLKTTALSLSCLFLSLLSCMCPPMLTTREAHVQGIETTLQPKSVWWLATRTPKGWMAADANKWAGQFCSSWESCRAIPHKEFSLSIEDTAGGGGRNILTSSHQSVCWDRA